MRKSQPSAMPGCRHAQRRPGGIAVARLPYLRSSSRAILGSVGALTRAETALAVRRLAAMRPHAGAVAPLVDADGLWRLCRDELTGVDVRMDGWDIRGRWFGVVVAATPRLGELPRGQTIPWRVVARYIASV